MVHDWCYGENIKLCTRCVGVHSFTEFCPCTGVNLVIPVCHGVIEIPCSICLNVFTITTE